jgi:predicted MFS family arabinose efflux permease
MPVSADLGDRKKPLRSQTFASLESADFRRFYLGQGISLIGTWLQAAAVRWIVFDRTGSEPMLGVMEAANLMPGLLVGIFAGAVADRFAPRTMILAMEAGQMLLAFALAVVVWNDQSSVWQMAMVLALARICVTFELPSRQVFLYEMVGPQNIPNAIALNSGLFNATRVIGPALAGLGLSVLGAAGCFFVNGISFVAAIAAVLAIRTVSAPSRTSSPRPFTLREVLGGLEYLGRAPVIRNHYLLMAYFGIMGMGYEAMMPSFARKVVGTGVQGYGVILACAGAGATVGALGMASLGGIRRIDRIVIAGMMVFSISLGAGAGFHFWVPESWPEPARVVAASLCLLGAGFGAVLFYAATQTRIQLVVPDHLRGRVMGIWMIVFSGSVPLGALWTGRAAAAWGVSTVMGCSAVLCFFSALVVVVSGVLGREASEPSHHGAVEPDRATA